MPDPSAMSPIYNQEATLHRMAYDRQLFREMIALLSEDGPRRLAELTAALARGDLPRVHHSAHSLKGLAANFNAARAVQAAGEVEQLAKSSQRDRLGRAVQELHAALDELLGELSRHTADAAAPAHLQENVVRS